MSASNPLPAEAPPRGPGALRQVVGNLGPLLGLLLLGAVLSILSEHFLTFNNLMNVARQSAINALIAVGMLLTILTAGIDLSVGSITAVSGVVMGIVGVKWGLNPFLAIAAGLAAGAFLGWVNGIVLTRLKLPHPFIATLGMMNVGRGLALLMTRSTPISGFPPVIQYLGAEYWGAVPVSILFVLLVYLAFHLFLNRTPLGRHIYAVGGNADAARLSGVRVDRVLTWVYTISGLMAGVGSLVLVGRVNAAFPLAGLSYELDAIAACIIGGASFFGGQGSVWGTLIGALIMAVLRNGLNLLNVSADWQTVAIGVVIVAAVYVDVLRQRAGQRRKAA